MQCEKLKIPDNQTLNSDFAAKFLTKNISKIYLDFDRD